MSSPGKWEFLWNGLFPHSSTRKGRTIFSPRLDLNLVREFFSDILDSPLPTIIVDNSQRIRFANNSFLLSTSLKREEIEKQTCQDLIYSQTCEICPLAAPHQEGGERRRPFQEDRFSKLKRICHPIKKEGQALGVLEFFFEESEEEKLRNEVRELQGKLIYAESVFKGITEPFFIVDRQMRVTFINDRAASVTKFKPEQVVGKKTCQEIFQSDICETDCAIKRAINTGKPVEGVRVWIKGRFEKPFPALVTAGVMRGQQGEIIGAFELVRDITAQVETEEALQNLSQEVKEFSASLAQAAQGTKLTINQVAQAVESFANDASNAAASAAQVARLAQDGQVIGSKTLDGLEKIKGKAQEMLEHSETLGKESSQIEEIVAVIRDITDQTDLLALNAAIEAARAGEHGRGFAVVANEVRKLAERAARSTKEIATRLAQIHETIRNSLQATREVGTGLDEGLVLGEQAKTSLDAIVNAVDGIFRRIESISASAQEISASSEEVAAGSKEVAELAARLENMALELDSMSKKLG